jgi:phosphoglycolate phosphatase
MLPYTLLVWDFDGTLADTRELAMEIFNRLAPRFRFRPIEDVQAARHLPTKQFLRNQGISFWRLPRVIRAFKAEMHRELERVRLFDGLEEILTNLVQGGFRLGILSSNAEANIRYCLKKYNLEHLFSFVVGYPKLFGKGKALRQIAKSEGLERSELIYIGDEVRDLQAARKARVASGAVSWGYHAQELLEEQHPQFIFHQPSDLLALVQCGSALSS